MSRTAFDSILWDRLAGELSIYVENYEIQKQIDDRNKNGKSGYSDRFLYLEPTYVVDYEINIYDELCANRLNSDINNCWTFQIASCENINDLPLYLKKLIKQFLPRFFEEYPQYKEAECLKIIDD